MLSHLKAQHRTVEKGLRNVNEYLGKVSDGAALDENGRARIQFNEVGLHVVALPTHNMVIFKTFINFLPDPASGKVLPLYYHLLDMNDEPETGMAYFSIVAAEEIGMEKDVISVEAKRPLADMSYQEFTSCAEAVGEVANAWMTRLVEEFEAPLVP